MKLFLLAVLITAQSAMADTAISWTAPTTFPDGTSLSGGEITGYKVYLKTMGAYTLYSSESSGTTSKSVPDGTYAVAATYSGGQTGLSDPVTVPDWTAALAAPEAANTVSTSDSRAAIQAKLDALTAGGVLYFRGGTYSHSTTGAGEGGAFFHVDVDGSSGNLITVKNYPGELPVISGVGWVDEDVGPAGQQDGLIRVDGDYIRVFGFKVQNSGGDGIRIRGSHCVIEECEVAHVWQFGILIGQDGTAGTDINNGTVKGCYVHHCRQACALAFIPDNEENYNMDGWQILECIGSWSGYNADGTINIFGGGNSDGFAVSKHCHDNYAFDIIDGNITGRWNRMHNLTVANCIFFRNADDGVDQNAGEGTIFQGNIAFHNGPAAAKGFKMLRDIYETQTHQGNIAISTDSSIFPDTTRVQFDVVTGSTAVTAGNTLTGATSGATGTVSAVRMFTNGNVSQVWQNGADGEFVLTGVTGTWQGGETLTVSGVNKATVKRLGQQAGVENRANDSDATKPYGGKNEVAWTSLHHNYTGTGSLRGMSSSTAVSIGGDWLNCLSHFNQDNDTGTTNFTLTTNFLNSTGGDPQIEDTTYEGSDISETLTGTTFRDQRRNLSRHIAGKVMATSGGNLYDAGTLDTDYYHATAADDPDTPSDPDDLTRLHWFESGKTTPTPDIGASQYQYLYPPVLTISDAAEAVPRSNTLRRAGLLGQIAVDDPRQFFRLVTRQRHN